MRIRSPVSAAIAFATAGATGGNGGSPKPVGRNVLAMKCASIASGQMMQGGKLSAFYALCKVTPNVPPDDGYAVGPAPFLPSTIWVCKN